MPTLGQHLLVEASAPRARLDAAHVRRALTAIVDALELTAVAPPQVHDGAIVAGVVLIEESHVSIHAIPAEGRLLADVFSCRPFDARRAVDVLTTGFDLVGLQTTIVERGVE